jgi:tetratricopeptide (TPR) repeat protein
MMLETVREYALEQLATTGERAALQDAHAGYYALLAEEAAPHLSGLSAARWLERLEEEHDNLRAALEWLLARQQVAESLRLAAALAPFWSAQGHFGEGRTRLAAVLALPGTASRPAERAAVLESAAAFAQRQGDLPAARRFLEESLGQWQTTGDRRGMARTLSALADAVFNLGEGETAHALWDESIALWRALGEQRELAHTLYLLAFLFTSRGERAMARTLLVESLHLARAAGDRVGIADAQAQLGSLAFEAGDYSQARALWTESHAVRLEVGDRWILNMHRISLGQLAIIEGEYAAARDVLAESLQFWRDAGVVGEMPADALRNFGWLAAAQGQSRRAIRLLAAARALDPTPSGYARWIAGAFEAALDCARRNLSADEQRVAEAEGRAMTLSEAIAYALDESLPS